jgi:lipopolysaccharide transport system ATP-binding protein
MNDIAIKVENLSKVYKLYGHPQDRLKEALNPFGKKYHHDYYALDDISFEVKRGEAVGIIGRNGAGKSTLLKIITDVLTVSRGSVIVNGRIASLLELGAGFNPDMTGLENIFFGGTLMGFSRQEMQNKLDIILNFADIGDFIYQPVKTYSSGMHVRLAFALNTVLEPDILIVDEALAVGDAIFVQKCIRYIRDFMEHGTLLFVSHDIASIKNLCTKTLWINEGKIESAGETAQVCENYLEFIYNANTNINKKILSDKVDLIKNSNEHLLDKNLIINNLLLATGFKTGKAEIISIEFFNSDNQPISLFEGGEIVKLIITAKADDNLENPILGFIIKDHLGQELFGENSIATTQDVINNVKPNQKFSVEFIFQMPILQNGEYTMMVSLAEGDNYNHIQHHYLHDACILNVQSSKIRFGIMSILFHSVKIKILDEKNV